MDKPVGTFDEDLVTDLEKKFGDIMKHLFNESNFHKINCKDINDIASYRENNPDFIQAVKGEVAAVYCIWRQQKAQEKFDLVYVGQAKNIRDRMRNHLSYKGEGTNSKLEEVQRAVGGGETIGVTFVKIDPPYMRTAVEGWLIREIAKTGEKVLLWNKRGKN
jgi:hypothetical protein